MEETRGITWGPYLYSKWEVHSDLVQEIVFTKNHFLVWPRVGDFKGQVVRSYLNTIWMTLCTPRCKSTTPGCYFYVFLLMVQNSTLVKKCVFYDSFFWMLLWHGADFTIDPYVHILYACHHNPLLIRNRSWILTMHKDRIFWKNLLEKKEMDFKMG